MTDRKFLRHVFPLLILTITGLEQLISFQTRFHSIEEVVSSGQPCIRQVPRSSIAFRGGTPKIDLYNNTCTPRRIAFVHVGKAGGNTVRTALPRLNCFRQRDPLRAERCYNRTARPYSPLSEATDLELHMKFGLSSPDQLRDDYTSFLFAIRNPLTRIMSAYHYLHPNNTDSVYAQFKHENKTQFYVECFPTEKDLLDAVDQVFEVATTSGNEDTTKAATTSTSSSSLSECQKLAIVTLRGKNEVVKHINAHIYYNNEFYMNLIDTYQGKEVLVVRTETLWNDLIELDKSLGGPGWFLTEGKVINANQNLSIATTTNGYHHGMTATPEQQKKLCCIIWYEIASYQRILKRAKNLLQKDIAQSMQQLTDICAVDPSTYDLNATRMNWRLWHKESCPNLDRLLLQR